MGYVGGWLNKIFSFCLFVFLQITVCGFGKSPLESLTCVFWNWTRTWIQLLLGKLISLSTWHGTLGSLHLPSFLVFGVSRWLETWLASPLLLKPLSKEYLAFSFLKSSRIYCLGTVFSREVLGRTLQSKHQRTSGAIVSVEFLGVMAVLSIWLQLSC